MAKSNNKKTDESKEENPYRLFSKKPDEANEDAPRYWIFSKVEGLSYEKKCKCMIGVSVLLAVLGGFTIFLIGERNRK